MWVLLLSTWQEKEGQEGKEGVKRSPARPRPWGCMSPSPAETSPRGPLVALAATGSQGALAGAGLLSQLSQSAEFQPLKTAFVSCSVSTPLCALLHRQGSVQGIK